ncbi:apolipoprotein L6-like isoform X1 [Lepisosteus oculatus]|uniref:apolipoprotein L6-like isoform X1 n=2 Tax=Lepisosteus oculatus TaxID=7918 RepID=UPI003718AB0C
MRVKEFLRFQTAQGNGSLAAAASSSWAEDLRSRVGVAPGTGSGCSVRDTSSFPLLSRLVRMEKNRDVGAGPARSGPQDTEEKTLLDSEDVEFEDETGEADSLLDWWYTEEGWDNWSSDEGFTEEQENRRLADTASRVYKGIQLFSQLFEDRAQELQALVDELWQIADGVDRFHRGATIASVTGGVVSAAGGIATITGLILAPFTFGASVIVTAVGLGVATAGGVTSASATVSDSVSRSWDRQKVEKVIQDYQERMKPIQECLEFVKHGMENLQRLDYSGFNEDIARKALPSAEGVFQAGARAGKGLANVSEIVRVVQLAEVASGAARAVRVASVATGVLSALFLGLDVFFIARDSMELHRGARTELAAKIREVAGELQAGLVELHEILGELRQSTGKGAVPEPVPEPAPGLS